MMMMTCNDVTNDVQNAIGAIERAQAGQTKICWIEFQPVEKMTLRDDER